MRTMVLFLLLYFTVTVKSNAQEKKDYTKETQEEYAAHMEWFKEAKYGMFIHFGLYSQLGGVWEDQTTDWYSEWIQATFDIPAQDYAMLTHTWNPKDFDADEIVKLAKDAGMKYIVITTKHHEGFCLWDSKYTNFDIANTPMNGRDILGELSTACRENGIKFGTYYSIIDWHHNSQQRNEAVDGNFGHWGQIQMLPRQRERYINYMKNQIKELVDNYDTDILWFDGDWVEWWNNDVGIDLYNYIRSLNPEIIINNRVGKRESFKKDFGTPEQKHFNSKVDYEWEACYTLNKSWGFKANDHNWKSPETVYNKLKEINGSGGNFLLNIGPDGDGNIPQKSADILREVGGMLNNEK
ncbi:alpha-L-fucosidase [Formosa sp. PL04]|uniref:alpha-L-fucosidase n=1 Tax=Formosa sp. PL04 TaxID=3081755 RepID=UPI002981522E|nr:alpha-L-fucosidase [Formosa sp. PL04]MDW5290130.1 alpha-L-fucosidase [Formosa sp. PL04]